MRCRDGNPESMDLETGAPGPEELPGAYQGLS